MNYKPILIVSGEPNSVFLEIFFKSLKVKKIKSPLILISSLDLLKLQMKKLKFKKKIKVLDYNKLKDYKLDNKNINLINVRYNTKKAFEPITNKSNNFIKNCFKIAFQLIKKEKISKLITGPISKNTFLNKNYLGLTEYLSDQFNVKNSAMIIYNKKLSVSPLTTHLPLKYVSKKINKQLIVKKIKLINKFYKEKLKINPKIAVVSLNPHCESIDPFNEDEKIIKPAIKQLIKSKLKVSGPYPGDTIFLKNNIKKFDLIVGMYHDQVLGPMKTLFEYDAINITAGLPFIRVSPDHGPNEKMLGKNKSNPLSLIKAILFLDNF